MHIYYLTVKKKDDKADAVIFVAGTITVGILTVGIFTGINAGLALTHSALTSIQQYRGIRYNNTAATRLMTLYRCLQLKEVPRDLIYLFMSYLESDILETVLPRLQRADAHNDFTSLNTIPAPFRKTIVKHLGHAALEKLNKTTKEIIDRTAGASPAIVALFNPTTTKPTFEKTIQKAIMTRLFAKKAQPLEYKKEEACVIL